MTAKDTKAPATRAHMEQLEAAIRQCAAESRLSAEEVIVRLVKKLKEKDTKCERN